MKAYRYCAAAMIAFVSAAALAEESPILISVVDEDGNRVEEARIWLQVVSMIQKIRLEGGLGTTEAATREDGALFFLKSTTDKGLYRDLPKDQVSTSVILTVSAPNYLYTQVEIPYEEFINDGPHTVTVSHGSTAELRIVGPDGNVYTDHLRISGHLTNHNLGQRIDILSPTISDDGIYTFQIEPSDAAFVVPGEITLTLETDLYSIDHRVPLALKEKSNTFTQEITLKNPGSVTIDAGFIESLPRVANVHQDNKVSLHRVTYHRQNGRLLADLLKREDLKAGVENRFTFDKLPPGEYQAKVVLGEQRAEHDWKASGYIFSEIFSVNPGENIDVVFNTNAPVPSDFVGDEIVTVGKIPGDIPIGELRLEGRIGSRPPIALPNKLQYEDDTLQILDARWDDDTTYRLYYRNQVIATARKTLNDLSAEPLIHVNVLP